MFALESVLRDRLAALPEFATWDVRGGSEEVSKRALPAVIVACDGVGVPDAKGSSVNVAVAWGVHLIVARSASATADLDAAFTAVIGSLLNHRPGKISGRLWSPLRMLTSGAAVQQPHFAEQGLVEYVVTFESSSVYQGQPLNP